MALMVVVVATEMGVVNLADEVVGVVPSVVKKIDAPAVESLRVTLCADA